MPRRKHIVPWHFAAIVLASLNIGLAHAAPFMIVGNDEKLLWDDDGKRVLFPAGKDSVVILQHVPTAMNRDSQDTPEVRV